MVLLYLSSDRMGVGDDALGRKLLLAFLRELAASDTRVDFVGCVNGAVALTTAGSEALAALQQLADKGARIATCGTCLSHHGMEDRLAIGGVGKMADTVALMARADRVIRPC